MMEIDIFCDMYKEWVKNMQHLGMCTSQAFKDLDQKQINILYNRKMFLELGLITKESDEYKYLISFIKLEIRTGLHIPLGLRKDELQKAYDVLNLDIRVPKDFKERDFWSTTQTFQVGGWFFDILSHLYKGFTQTDKTMY